MGRASAREERGGEGRKRGRRHDPCDARWAVKRDFMVSARLTQTEGVAVKREKSDLHYEVSCNYEGLRRAQAATLSWDRVTWDRVSEAGVKGIEKVIDPARSWRLVCYVL